MKKREMNQSSKRQEYLITENVTFDITEAFRNFKASLTVSIPKKSDGKGQVIMMTSACPEDGKTTVAVNLALMFAISEAKVIIVDADIRKGRVARFFKKRSKPGLADYLSGQVKFEEVVRKTDHGENLSYISCGTHSPRPYELLESAEMKNLIAKLREEYDYIILDTPPVILVSDALALATEADGAVVVCRHQSSYVSDVGKTIEKLRFAKANVLGVVVNDYVSYEKQSARSKRYRYYNYAYTSLPGSDE